MPEQRLLLVGFGNVGQALARLLIRKRGELAERQGLHFQVVGILTRHHGAALAAKGIDLEQALELIEQGQPLSQISEEPAPLEARDFIRAAEAEVLFENTPVNYDTGQPAVEHIRLALEAGMHAITANKGPVVHAHRELTKLAHSRGLGFRYEASVMDGAPIFSLWRDALPGARLHSFRGVLNSTTNLMLTLMENGLAFEEAVSHAQAVGIAETDPRGDTEGWDAAIKVATLVNVLMGASVKPHDIRRRGIEDLTREAVLQAREQGKRWKLVCRASMEGDQLEASVWPELLEPDDPLFSVEGTSSAITFMSDVLGPLTLIERDPGPDTTAYGLLADFLAVVSEPSRPGRS